MSDSTKTVSTWTPLRNGLFRALWLAVLVSNVATWMQTVGAQWLLVGQPNATILVALVQTVDYLPDMLFGLVGGVLADSFDRRRLLMAVQGLPGRRRRCARRPDPWPVRCPRRCC